MNDDGNVLDEGCLVGTPRDRELYFSGGPDALWSAEAVDRDTNIVIDKS